MTSHYRPGRTSRSHTVIRSTAMLGATTAIALLAAGCATADGQATQDDNGAKHNASRASATKDGTYSATGKYTSPGGLQSVDVDLTLKDGVISDITVTPGAVDAQSERFQTDFAKHVAEKVKGKSLADADVSVVASSSLTSEGFNSALDKIASEAQ